MEAILEATLSVADEHLLGVVDLFLGRVLEDFLEFRCLSN